MAKQSKKKEADDNKPIPDDTPMNPDIDGLSDILADGEFLVTTSKGAKYYWNEIADKPNHRDMLLDSVNRHLDKKGFPDQFSKTVDGEDGQQNRLVFNTTRSDVKADTINKLIDSVNEQYERIADAQGLEGDNREPPIVGRLHIGTSQLSTDLSSFNNTMINLDIPHKWGVRKTKQDSIRYTIVKLQRIERG